jgi:hypothetical protein
LLLAGGDPFVRGFFSYFAASRVMSLYRHFNADVLLERSCVVWPGIAGKLQ